MASVARMEHSGKYRKQRQGSRYALPELQLTGMNR
jgi:hypothetical protein